MGDSVQYSSIDVKVSKIKKSGEKGERKRKEERERERWGSRQTG